MTAPEPVTFDGYVYVDEYEGLGFVDFESARGKRGMLAFAVGQDTLSEYAAKHLQFKRVKITIEVVE